jgi:hypothetical protein
MMGSLLIVRVEAGTRVLGTVSFSSTDASIYLRPIGAATAVYDYGFVEIPAGTAELTFETSGQLQASERPHVSIHDSGTCHVRSGKQRASRIHANEIQPLKNYRGHHVVTIFTSDVTALSTSADNGSARSKKATRSPACTPRRTRRYESAEHARSKT